MAKRIRSAAPAANTGGVSNVRIAVITGIFTVISALAAILAAWLSSNMAADSASKTTITQLAGETERSRAEFLRSQRQTAYAALLADAIDLQKVERIYAHSITYNLVDAKQQSSSLFSKLQKWTVDLATIEIIGSDGAVTKALALNDEIFHYQSSLADRDHPIGKPANVTPSDGGTPQQKAQEKKDDAEGVTITNYRGDFIGAARNDLVGS